MLAQRNFSQVVAEGWAGMGMAAWTLWHLFEVILVKHGKCEQTRRWGLIAVEEMKVTDFGSKPPSTAISFVEYCPLMLITVMKIRRWRWRWRWWWRLWWWWWWRWWWWCWWWLWRWCEWLVWPSLKCRTRRPSPPSCHLQLYFDDDDDAGAWWWWWWWNFLYKCFVVTKVPLCLWCWCTLCSRMMLDGVLLHCAVFELRPCCTLQCDLGNSM